MKRFSLTTIKSFVWRAAFIMLILVMVSSHFTFRYAARFTSSVTGSDSAHVAFFVGGDVQDGQLKPQATNVTLKTYDNPRYYIFRAGIEVTFAPCEVAREFTFSLSLNSADAKDEKGNPVDSSAFLACPAAFSNNLFMYYDSETPDDPATDEVQENFPFLEDNGDLYNVIDQTGIFIENGMVYFTSYVNPQESSWKTEKNGDYVDVGSTVTTINYTPTAIPLPISTENIVYTFEFLFFIDAYRDREGVGEDGDTLNYDHPIKYDLDCWQVD